MKQKILSALKYFLFLCFGIGLLWLAFRNQDFQKMSAAFKHANYAWIGVSVLLSLFAFISRAYRWNMLIKPMGYHPSLANSTYSLMVGYFANFAVPRLGEVSRCAMLGSAEKIPMDKLIGTVIAERVVDVITLGFVFLLLAIIQFKLLGGFLLDKFVHPIIAKISGNSGAVMIAASFTALACFALWFFLVRNKSGEIKSPWKIKSEEFLKGLWQGIQTVLRLENNLSFLAHTVFIWTIYFLVSFTCFFAFEATSNLSPASGLFTLAIGGVGMSMPVQGGIGTYHWMVSEGLSLYGISFEDALIYATMVHASQTVFIIVTGGISYFILIFKRKRISVVE